MQRIRVRLSKDDRVRFVSHLDFLRVLTRVIRRARLPVALTQGFNPHLKISFGSILPVGATSEVEYIDFELKMSLEPETFMAHLNKQLPPGFHVIEAREMPVKIPSLQGKLNRIVYQVKLMLTGMEQEYLEDAIHSYLKKEVISLTKKTKRGMKEINIRPLIEDMTVISQENDVFTLELVLVTGNTGNVRPEQVIEGMLKYELLNVEPEWIRVHRIALYLQEGSKVITPWEIM